MNFKQLHRVLDCAGDKKLKEIQLCLEGWQLMASNLFIAAI
jgi:hypothetical protein